MLILLIALPLLTGLAAALPFPSRRGRLTFLLTMQIIETALVVWTLVSGRSYTTNIWHLTESLTIAMKLDGVAAVFSALTVVAWLLALIYSVEYMSHSQNEARFYVFLFLSEGMLLGTALSADFVSMYVFYELTSLCSMPLVLHELTHDAVTGAMKYLYYSIGGAFFVLFGIVVLYTNTSTLDFAPGGTLIAGQHTGLELLAVFFVVLGFGTKAGLFPMHNWLPSAHPVAPAPASALLSGIITKAGVIGIIPGDVGNRLIGVASPRIQRTNQLIDGCSCQLFCGSIPLRFAHLSTCATSRIIQDRHRVHERRGAVLQESLLHRCHRCAQPSPGLVQVRGVDRQIRAQGTRHATHARHRQVGGRLGAHAVGQLVGLVDDDGIVLAEKLALPACVDTEQGVVRDDHVGLGGLQARGLGEALVDERAVLAQALGFGHRRVMPRPIRHAWH